MLTLDSRFGLQALESGSRICPHVPIPRSGIRGPSDPRSEMRAPQIQRAEFRLLARPAGRERREPLG